MTGLAEQATPGVGSGKGELANRYNGLVASRLMYVQRAREASRLTIPYLFPPYDGANAATVYPTPYQAIGARGLNNLASKLLQALFPPNALFMRMMIEDDPQILKMIAQDPSFKSELDAGLAKYEDAIERFTEASNSRPVLFEVLKQLLVAGNVLLHAHADKDDEKQLKLKFYRLDHYVVKRATNGKVLEIITAEDTDPMALPAHTQLACNLIQAAEDSIDDPSSRQVTIYTQIKRVSGEKKFTVKQEINGYVVPDSEGEYPAHKVPWMALRWAQMHNEDYGRSFCEEYLGDLKSAEGLSKALLEASAIAAKVVPLVNPNGITKMRDLTQKASGEPIVGMPEDVHFLQVEKMHDFKVAAEQLGSITQRLEQAFLLANSIQRDAERVTAEEIRVMAEQLETAYGGVYSLLSQELQLPLARVIIDIMEKQNRLPKLPKGAVSMAIVTGMEALGRGQDLQKLQTFIQGTAQDLGPGVIQQFINMDEYFRRKATALYLDTTALIKTQDQVQQEQQQAQGAQIQHQIAPQIAAGVMRHKTATAVQAMKNNHEQQMAQQAGPGQ